MNSTKYIIIQWHAVISILGYWFMHSMLSLTVGETGRVVSIVYDGMQLLLSIIVMMICKKDLFVERGRSFLSFFSVLLVAYTIRMVYDMYAGPFSLALPISVFFNDILLTVFCTFMSAWAIIASRKYLNVDSIVHIVFLLCTITILAVVINLNIRGVGDIYEEERLDAGRGLGSLALAKIGAIQVLASLHLLLNTTKYKWVYLLGLLLGGWLTLASGSRGGLAGLVIALGVYFWITSRRNILLMLISTTILVVVFVNMIPILTWLSGFFPVVGNRMLETILENDQSGRELLRQQAIDLIIQHPVFGYSYRLNTDITGYGVHNGILSVFLALGIPIGLLFIYFVYIKGLVFSMRMMKDKHFLFPSVLFIFIIVASMSGSSVTDSRFDFAVCILGAFYYYNDNHYNDNL